MAGSILRSKSVMLEEDERLSVVVLKYPASRNRSVTARCCSGDMEIRKRVPFFCILSRTNPSK